MKRSVFATLVLLVVNSLTPQAASGAQPFEVKAFEKAQKAGKTTLVHVGASWCSVCEKQKPIIQQIEKELPELVVYEVDFESDKDTVKLLGVRYRTTLIAFKGPREIARSIGETDPSGIRALVAAAL